MSEIFIAPHSVIRDQLARVLSSAQFGHAQSLSRLLQFVVDETLNGRGAQLKEARLGLEVINRPAQSYDSAIDPIVRVQMGRLRARLRTYYDTDGANDPVRIDVPKGSYVPVFSLHSPAATSPVSPRATLSSVSAPRLAVLPFVNMSSD